MTRIYDDRGFVMRNWVSMAILAAAVIWGGVEILRAAKDGGDTTGYLFGAGFLAASAYGLNRILGEARDAIVRIEADSGSGQSVVTLWRPWGLHRLTGPLEALSGWRLFIAVKARNQNTYLLRADHPDNPRPLQIELHPAKPVPDGLRRLAGEAIEEFEANTGGRKTA